MPVTFRRTRIKICGINNYDMAMAAVDTGADAIGFMFAKQSPRYIEPEAAYEIMVNLPPLVATVGVFVDPTADEFSDIEEICPTTYTQLHGEETDRFVKQVGPDVIRALKFDPDATPQALMKWDGLDEVGAILIDGSAGGEGKSFDWGQLPPMLDDVSKPIFVAGGLNAGNVGEAIRIVRPYAVDVSSGVEVEKGMKDAELIEEFCRAVREADREQE